MFRVRERQQEGVQQQSVSVERQNISLLIDDTVYYIGELKMEEL